MELEKYAFLASEEYAKESIKDLKLNQGAVFDKNAAGSTDLYKVMHCMALFFVWF